MAGIVSSEWRIANSKVANFTIRYSLLTIRKRAERVRYSLELFDHVQQPFDVFRA